MTNGTKVYLHGKRDTYNMREANRYKWETVGLKKGQKGAVSDFKGMYEFWRGMIAFRKSNYGNVFYNTEAVPVGYYQFIAPENEAVLGYIINEKVLVVMNVSDSPATVKGVKLPAGKWKLIGGIDGVNHTKGISVKGQKASLKGGSAYDFSLDGTDFVLYVKE
jgi:hypothetical protein